MTETKTELTCQCGQVSMSVMGSAIISAECFCTDCQKAGAILQARNSSPRVLGHNSATRFVLYRKDKVEFHTGQEEFREYYLEKHSTTRRIIASCCNTPLFLEFSGGHWLSIYGFLWSAENLPPLAIRTMTRSCPDGIKLPDDVPNPKTHTFSFYFKLLKAWAAMGFRVPKLDFIAQRLDS